MNYSEASYFDGYAFAHIAAWQDFVKRQRAESRMVQIANGFRALS